MGKMWTWSENMVRVLHIDGPQVRFLPMATFLRLNSESKGHY